MNGAILPDSVGNRSTHLYVGGILLTAVASSRRTRLVSLLTRCYRPIMKIGHPIVVLRHPKERRSKCTMQPMRWAPGFFFFNARPGFRYNATGHLLLAREAPVLAAEDGGWESGGRERVEAEWSRSEAFPQAADFASFPTRPILLLDATWRRLPQVAECVFGNPIQRSLPAGWRTAYPRVNQDGEDPIDGLATIEALFAALWVLGEARSEILRGYHWGAEFLRRNRLEERVRIP